MNNEDADGRNYYQVIQMNPLPSRIRWYCFTNLCWYLDILHWL